MFLLPTAGKMVCPDPFVISERRRLADSGSPLPSSVTPGSESSGSVHSRLWGRWGKQLWLGFLSCQVKVRCHLSVSGRSHPAPSHIRPCMAGVQLEKAPVHALAARGIDLTPQAGGFQVELPGTPEVATWFQRLSQDHRQTRDGRAM